MSANPLREEHIKRAAEWLQNQFGWHVPEHWDSDAWLSFARSLTDSVTMPIVQQAKADAVRDFGDYLLVGPAIPLPPSVFRQLAYEKAEALDPSSTRDEEAS